MQFEISMAMPIDLELLVRHRLRMFDDIFPEIKDKIQASEGLTREWIKQKMSTGELVGFIAKTKSGKVAGSGCLWMREEQPRPTTSIMKAPYLMSVYTERAFRRTDVARLVVQAAIKWAQENGYDRINLHASEVGRPLYESLGFEETNEMRLKW